MGILVPGNYVEVDEETVDEAAWIRENFGTWQDACFLCSQKVDYAQPLVYWAGTENIVLHPDCARHLGAALLQDAREADLASSRYPHRAMAVAKSVLRKIEWQAT